MTKLQKRWNLDKMKIKVLQILEQRVKIVSDNELPDARLSKPNGQQQEKAGY